MLYGCKELVVYTDHKNLTFNHLKTERALSWRLFLEEYVATLHHISGIHNAVADALSRLPVSERPNTSSPLFPEKPNDTRFQNQSPDSIFSMAISEGNLLYCFVHLPAQQDDVPFRIDYQTIAQAQMKDAALGHQAKSQPLKILRKLFASNSLVYCYVPIPEAPWKI